MRLAAVLDGPRRVQLTHIVLGVIFLLALARHVRVTVLLQRGQIPGDFALIWTAGLSAQRGVDLYDPAAGRALVASAIGEARSGWYSTPLLGYTHPPSEVLLPWLLAFLPWRAAMTLWQVFLQLTYAAVIGGLVWLLREHGASPAAQWLFAILALLLIPAQFSIEVGQWDVPLFALLLLTLALAQRGRLLLAGVALGLAACIKPTPVLLLGLFLVRRDWRAIGGAVGTAVVVIGLSILLVGIEAWRVWTFEILPQLLRGSTFVNNQTFNGLGYFLFADAALLYSQQLPPDIPAARLLSTGLSLSVLVGVLALARRFAPTDRGWCLQLAYGLFVVAMLITPSISWAYYYTWALLPLALVLAPGAGTSSGTRRWLWLPLVLVAYGLIVLPRRFHTFDVATYNAWWALRLLIPLKVYGAILLGAMLVQVLRIARRQERNQVDSIARPNPA